MGATRARLQIRRYAEKRPALYNRAEWTFTRHVNFALKMPPGDTPKRIACDRCRTQKLRCLSDTTSSDLAATAAVRPDPCARCRANNVECVYTAPRRAGRPRGKAPVPVTGDIHPPSSPGPYTPAGGHASDNAGRDTSTVAAVAERSLASDSNQLAHHKNSMQDARTGACLTLSPAFDGPASESVDNLNAGVTSLVHTETLHDEPFTQSLSSPFLWNDPLVTAYGTEFHTVATLPSPVHEYGQLSSSQQSVDPSRASHREESPSESRWQARDASQTTSLVRQSGTNLYAQSTDDDISMSNTGSAYRPDRIDFRDRHVSDTRDGQKYAKDLSDLTLKIHTYSNRHEHNLKTPLGSLSTLKDLVADVLDCSTQFSHLLSKLTQPSMKAQSRTTDKGHGRLTSDADAGGTSYPSSQSTIRTLAIDRDQLRSQSGSIRGESYRGPVVLDVTASLQLLTCYIRLLQLHSTLYKRILAEITMDDSQADSDNIPLLFPSLHVGDFSLAPFAKLQVKFLVQVVVHTLGRVENLLGLPAGHRVSRHTGESENATDQKDARRGILEASVSTRLIQTVLQEASSAGKHPIQGTLDLLASLKERLRATIDM